MKNFQLITSLLGLLSLQAFAEQQLMKDSGSQKLAATLKGKTLRCGPSQKSTQAKGFFPLTITATAQTAGTLLSVETKDPRVGFGYGGSDFDVTEITENWTILSCGDDGRRHLMLQQLDVEDSGNVCTDKSDNITGNIGGIVTEIWDAGNSTSEGVQCCVAN